MHRIKNTNRFPLINRTNKIYRYLVLLSILLLQYGFSIDLLPDEIHDPKYDWMDESIERAFAHFTIERINKKDIEEATRENKPYINRYRIINNQIHGRGACVNLLQEILNHTTLPDLDFLYFEGNGPIDPSDLPKTNVPILVGFKNKHMSNAICFQNRYFLNTINPEKNWIELNQQLKDQSCSWDKKKPKMIWRGKTLGPHEIYRIHNWKKMLRGRLVALSLLSPDLIDAKFTRLVHFRSSDYQKLIESMGSGLGSPQSYLEQSHYKYAIYLDQNGTALIDEEAKLLSGALLFKPDSLFQQWYSDALEPFIHYIPVERNLSDLLEQINWAYKNEAKARSIALNGRLFAIDFLSPKGFIIYCIKLLKIYAEYQNF
ncbi:MAG: hypothetical protein K9M07_02820 [Simkaniaceae bacterium]|nr:hypothetical protein [Simkaniaceae bacterium]